MGRIRIYPPVKYICAVTVADSSIWEDVRSQLESLFSPIDRETDWYPFTHTDYYTPEMGKGLKKRMVSFTDLDMAEKLPDFKIATNEIEAQFQLQGKRRVNLDPGYICNAKLILATTKDYSHRIYLGRGIFGDVHLRFIKHQFQPNEWTYPDYREPFVIRFFEEVRARYLQQLAELPTLEGAD